MSRTITNINSGTDTYQIWLDKTNDLINAVSIECVTTNSHANGALTTGNGYVQGFLGGANLVCTNLRGGTIQTPAVLAITSNINFTADTITCGGVIVNSSDISIGGTSVTQMSVLRFTHETEGGTDQEVHNFSKLSFRGGDYVVTVKDLNANQYQMEKVLVLHDSGAAYTTEFGVLISNTNLGEFSANANATHVRLYLTPTVANTHVSGSVVLVTV